MKNSGSFKPAGQEPHRGKGGARPGAGRKTKQVVADEARANEIAKENMARGLGEILATLKKVALGVKRIKFYPPHILEDRRKKNPKARNFYYEIEYHPATIHFWIERFVPAARQGVDITVDSPEEFYRALEAARRLEAETQARRFRNESRVV